MEYKYEDVCKNRKFYFTFGSDPGFPYQNTYLIVYAENLEEAINKFREHFPDRHKDTINCAFYYTEKQWKDCEGEEYYKEPVCEIT